MAGMATINPSSRVTSYSPTSATTTFAAGFPVADLADLTLYVNGSATACTVTGNTLVDGFYTDASCNVASPGVTGDVKVVGTRVPRRTDQFSTSGTVSPADQNLALNRLAVENQEEQRDADRALKTGVGSPAIPAGHVPIIASTGNAIDGGSAGSNLVNAATQTEAAAAPLTSDATYMRIAGRAAAGDGVDAVYRRRSTDPAHPAKIKRSDADWLEWSDDGRGFINTSIFAGGVGAQFNLALQAIAALADDKTVGPLPDTLGIRIKPNTYVIDETLTLAGSITKSLGAIHVDGRGVQIKPNGLPTAMKVQFGSRITIDGVQFNWRGVSDASQIILVDGNCGWLTLNNIGIVSNSSSSDFAAVRVKQRLDNVAGERDTGNFWLRLNRLWHRKFAGGDANKSAYVVDLQGCNNEALFRDCSFSGFSDSAVLIRNQNNSNTSAISAPVNFDGCAFEDGGNSQVGVKWRAEGGIANPFPVVGGGARNCRFEGTLYCFATEGLSAQVQQPFMIGGGNTYVSNILGLFKTGTDENHFAFDDVSVTPAVPGLKRYWNGGSAYLRNLSVSEPVLWLVNKVASQGGSLVQGAADKGSSSFRLSFRAGTSGSEVDGGSQGQVRLAHIRGFSTGASGVQRSNVRGATTSPTSGTTATVTFATAEPDANYDILLPQTGSSRMWVTGKTATAFTINTDTAFTAPVSIPWILIGY